MKAAGASHDPGALGRAPRLDAWTRRGDELAELSSLIEDMRATVDVGMCASPQPEYLYCLSSALRGTGEIVEIGTLAGHSLVALATAQKHAGGTPVTAIDPAPHPRLREHVRRAGLEDWVNLIEGRAEEVLGGWSSPIELLWIDGDHSPQAVRRDILGWKDFVVGGGLIVLHDYATDFGGVAPAVHETLLTAPRDWRVVSDREFGSIVVFQRLETDLAVSAGFERPRPGAAG